MPNMVTVKSIGLSQRISRSSMILDCLIGHGFTRGKMESGNNLSVFSA